MLDQIYGNKVIKLVDSLFITFHVGLNVFLFFYQNLEAGLSSPVLWLIASADRRVSIWSADWSRDTCELVDWLTFPAPAFTPDGAPLNKDDNVCP